MRFSAICAKKLPKTKISFHARNFRKKYFRFCANCSKKYRKTAQNLLRFMRKSSQKTFCAKIAQILRKRFTHFVETLHAIPTHDNSIPFNLFLIKNKNWQFSMVDLSCRDIKENSPNTTCLRKRWWYIILISNSDEFKV